MASAASRSAAPAARVSSVSTASPLRFSISTWPMKQSRLAWPSPLRNSRASASVVERCVSFRALLAMEVPLAVATRSRRRARTVLRPEALRARPGLDQRAVDREVLVRKQPFDLRVVEHGGEELRSDLAAQQPVAVLGEY